MLQVFCGGPFCIIVRTKDAADTGCRFGTYKRREEVRVRARIGMIVLAAVLLLVQTGCGTPQQDDAAQSETLQNKTLQNKTLQNKALQETEDAAAQQLRDTLTPSIVQITCGKLLGSGVIWRITDDTVTILSAKHLLQAAPACDVTFFEGEYYRAQVTDLCGDHDLAFAQIAVDQMDAQDVKQLRAVTPFQDTEVPSEGEQLYLYGSADYIAGVFLEGTLEEADIYLDDFQDEMLVGNAQVQEGMSGCGVFDAQGRLLGILAGGNDDTKRFAAVPVRFALEEAARLT